MLGVDFANFEIIDIKVFGNKNKNIYVFCKGEEDVLKFHEVYIWPEVPNENISHIISLGKIGIKRNYIQKYGTSPRPKTIYEPHIDEIWDTDWYILNKNPFNEANVILNASWPYEIIFDIDKIKDQ